MSNSRNIPDHSGLQLRANLKAFLAGRNMKPEAYGTFDVSLEWPLELRPQHATIVLAAGVSDYKILAKPATGRHALVLRAQTRIAAPTANDSFFVVYRPAGLTALTTVQNEDVILNSFLGGNGFAMPLIGGAANFGFFSLSSAPPVYVPFGYECAVIQTSNVGDTAQLNWLAVDYPATQPLTSLLKF